MVRLYMSENVLVYIYQHDFPISLNQPGVTFVNLRYSHRNFGEFSAFDGFKAFSGMLVILAFLLF